MLFLGRPVGTNSLRSAVLILALLGLMTFAAVETTTIQCRNEHDRLLSNRGGCIELNSGSCLLINSQHPQCEVVTGYLRWAVPERAVAILRKLGVPLFYI